MNRKKYSTLSDLVQAQEKELARLQKTHKLQSLLYSAALPVDPVVSDTTVMYTVSGLADFLTIYDHFHTGQGSPASLVRFYTYRDGTFVHNLPAEQMRERYKGTDFGLWLANTAPRELSIRVSGSRIQMRMFYTLGGRGHGEIDVSILAMPWYARSFATRAERITGDRITEARTVYHASKELSDLCGERLHYSTGEFVYMFSEMTPELRALFTDPARA